MSVWLSDLAENWLSWLALGLTCVVSAAGFAEALVLLTSTSDAGAVGGTILGMAIFAVVLVTWSQMRLVVEEHSEVYRSWRMVGMPGWLVVALVLGQAAVVSAAGSAAGAWVSHFSFDWVGRTLGAERIPTGELTLSTGVWLSAVLVCVCSSLLGTLFALRRVFTQSSPRWVALKALLGVAAIGGTVFGVAQIPDPDDRLGGCMGLVLVVALMTPWVLPLLDQWTRVLGIAGANVRVRRRFSSPQILPWVLGGGLIVAVGSGLRALLAAEEGQTVSSWQMFVVVLSPTLAPCLALALTTSLLMRRRISSDSHGLKLAGAVPTMIARVQLREACALTLTATGIIAAMSLAVTWLINQSWSTTGFWGSALAITAAGILSGLALVKLAVLRNSRSRPLQRIPS
ncbi:FtsX-like permease family protein [Corynebacterium sp.]|uniref:FtsX-like permease family protein n=1 Tax=Corynebacterium sp. TaxID=1720 RepID=UPI0026DC7EE8|nr:FtsX-like permease family protein [Corynebacterium sp.]MDO5032140.1 ABC transporter permease [Corynebacterium sp.]